MCKGRYKKKRKNTVLKIFKSYKESLITLFFRKEGENYERGITRKNNMAKC